ncbi:MAG: Arginine transport ATP-binding protein ArtM [Phycisphaerales bacterium]|nr:Arginine transport ATP-binding protein ArtM [Phycisphaerales bacterium]MCK6475600.1 ATP-binding cassette domain-containing protein [Phycisphaerales bacterium]
MATAAMRPLELQAKELVKSFGEQPVIRKISLDIARGEMVCVVGGSGSGKTVLMHMLAGLLATDAGRVWAADHSLPSAPLVDLATLDSDAIDRVRLHWAVVFQKNALFSGTVFDNIALLLREHHAMARPMDPPIDDDLVREKASMALTAVALNAADVIDKDRDALSGGMAKRVAIARAIAIDPALIFYDEPTTGLDPVISGHIHELIFSTHHAARSSGTARTSLIVTHDKELLRRLQPRVLMLHEGEIAFDGPYSAFQSQPTGPAHDYLQAMPVLHARR